MEMEREASRGQPIKTGKKLERVDRCLKRSEDWFKRDFIHSDADDRTLPPGEKCDRGYWVGELEADTTLESDYIIFLYYLNPDAHREKIRKLANYIRSKQLPDGAWNIYYDGPGELSASVKAYFALKLADHSPDEPFMVKAREAIHAMGGAGQVNCFTKIYLCFLGQFSWDDCPAIPPEILLLPRFFYFNIYEMSYWSRAILVPLSILFALKPRKDLPPKYCIPELFLQPRPGLVPETGEDAQQRIPANGEFTAAHIAGSNGNASNTNGNGYSVRRPHSQVPDGALARDPKLFTWRNFFLLVDRLLKLIEKTPVKPLRPLAIKRAEEWIIKRFENSDGLGAIFPAMVNSVIALRSLGYAEDDHHIVHSLNKLRELEIEDRDADGNVTVRLQPCVSPVWDTAMVLNALSESGMHPDDPIGVKAARWLVSKEARSSGDWKMRCPDLHASGWYFQFKNEFYPDVDDTAEVLLALERVNLEGIEGAQDAVQRGIDWILRMQCSNGGWAAFDVDIDHEILTHVPFADHNAMLDPACADISGRVLEMFGRFSQLRDRADVKNAVEKGIAYLRSTQESNGPWYGRWGVNYIYGTWQCLKGLVTAGVPTSDGMVRSAAAWLKSIQNSDGGWGESCESYADPSKMGLGTSTKSQSAWAVMGLIAAGEIKSAEVETGIQYLLDTQHDDGTWEEKEFTGTGFPCVFYLRYHLYCQYFPHLALADYRNAQGESPATGNRVSIGVSARSPAVR
jgi:squalene-hopene/tetraprenyl-beta-curcumene cyclase